MKIDQTFNSSKDFSEYFFKKYVGDDFREAQLIDLDSKLFNYDVKIPFKLEVYNDQLLNTSKWKEFETFLTRYKYDISDCQFNNKVTIVGSQKELIFSNCNFNNELVVTSRSTNLTFKDCLIKDLDLAESTFGSTNRSEGKLRIKSCNVYKTNFKNTTFYALVDFYYTTFHENIIFYKTDFLNIVVLSASKFKKNLLFTYTLLNDKVIMRSTIFEKGYDFSLAIIKGQLAIFDLHHSYKSYSSQRGLINEKEYEKAVSYQGTIPIQNKLETYRLLKVEFEYQKNIPESLNFKLYEKKTFKKILEKQNFTWKNLFDQITLWLNEKSNNHGTSYVRAFFFITISGWIFFYFSLISTDSYEFTLNPIEWEFNNGLGNFIQFLLPLHKFNYMGDQISTNSYFYLFDFLGRIFVGYGIYQFIQAFRKYK